MQLPLELTHVDVLEHHCALFAGNVQQFELLQRSNLNELHVAGQVVAEAE